MITYSQFKKTNINLAPLGFEQNESFVPYDACSIGIIGGADGPTALIFSSPNGKKTAPHTALSALHFEPVDDIEWEIIFREKPMEDIEVDIVPCHD